MSSADDLAAVGEPYGAATGDVVADLADRPDRVLEGHVAQHHVVVLEHPQHAGRRADLHEVGVLAHVRVADDDVEAAVLLGVGVRLVAGVDDRSAAGGRRRDALPDVLGALGDRVRRTAGGLQHLAGAGVDLAADEERDQHLGVVAEVVVATGQVVLVAAVAVAGGVGVVLEQVDRAADATLRRGAARRTRRAARGSAPPPCRARRGRRASRTPGVAYSGCEPTSRYRRAPFCRNTFELRPHDTTRRNRYRATSSGLRRRWPRSVHVTPYSFSSP